MKLLVTGGSVFVSKRITEYFINRRNKVYVLNRGTHSQVKGVHLIQADRNYLKGKFRDMEFDAIIDVTSYSKKDIIELLQSGVKFSEYIFISSGAVYPEYGEQPFKETEEMKFNCFWGIYGKNKIEAEKALCRVKKDAYILRPCYLYGPYNNIYRESFVFDCAMNHRKFYMPENENMSLQFFYIDDLCRFIEIILKEKPNQRVFNIGNEKTITIRKWVELCYQIVGEPLEYVHVSQNISQKNYFPFPEFEYKLDVSRLNEWIGSVQDIRAGLQQSYEWYKENLSEVKRKDYMKYIDRILCKIGAF